MAALAKLQRLIDRCAKTGAAYHRANAALNDFCLETYGCEPGDIDADEIIDTVLGGCGAPVGMSAEHFDRIMREGGA